MDQLDKKKKVVLEQQTKGEKLAQDPKAPKFLNSYMDRLKALWVDANKQAEDRLSQLKGIKPDSEHPKAHTTEQRTFMYTS